MKRLSPNVVIYDNGTLLKRFSYCYGPTLSFSLCTLVDNVETRHKIGPSSTNHTFHIFVYLNTV